MFGRFRNSNIRNRDQMKIDLKKSTKSVFVYKTERQLSHFAIAFEVIYFIRRRQDTCPSFLHGRATLDMLSLRREVKTGPHILAVILCD